MISLSIISAIRYRHFFRLENTHQDTTGLHVPQSISLSTPDLDCVDIQSTASDNENKEEETKEENMRRNSHDILQPCRDRHVLIPQDSPPHPSMLTHMLRSLTPGQDLTRAFVPAFLLESRSILEKLADPFMHVDLLLRVGCFLYNFCRSLFPYLLCYK